MKDEELLENIKRISMAIDQASSPKAKLRDLLWTQGVSLAITVIVVAALMWRNQSIITKEIEILNRDVAEIKMDVKDQRRDLLQLSRQRPR